MNTLMLPNVIAMVSASFAIAAMWRVIPKIGGVVGRMLRFIVIGIFFAVFIHAAVELSGILGFIDERSLMAVMGVLLTLGSVSLFIAGYIGIKNL